MSVTKEIDIGPIYDLEGNELPLRVTKEYTGGGYKIRIRHKDFEQVVKEIISLNLGDGVQAALLALQDDYEKGRFS